MFNINNNMASVRVGHKRTIHTNLLWILIASLRARLPRIWEVCKYIRFIGDKRISLSVLVLKVYAHEYQKCTHSHSRAKPTIFLLTATVISRTKEPIYSAIQVWLNRCRSLYSLQSKIHHYTIRTSNTQLSQRKLKRGRPKCMHAYRTRNSL